MGAVVNLRKLRKAAERRARAQVADENAVKFGRSKTEKAAQAALTDKLRRDLDGKRIT